MLSEETSDYATRQMRLVNLMSDGTGRLFDAHRL